MWKKASPRSQTSQYTRGHTQEKNPINVMNVGTLFTISQPSLYIKEFIQERDPMNVLSVGKPSIRTQPSINIEEHIWVWKIFLPKVKFDCASAVSHGRKML